ncbi:unnamed protein product [Amoebophrya sp. A25]|nr:unnamed protein product [Amoebophrya sp. A25]|eukprot:GSA25T00012047001.1
MARKKTRAAAANEASPTASTTCSKPEGDLEADVSIKKAELEVQGCSAMPACGHGNKELPDQGRQGLAAGESLQQKCTEPADEEIDQKCTAAKRLAKDAVGNIWWYKYSTFFAGLVIGMVSTEFGQRFGQTGKAAVANVFNQVVRMITGTNLNVTAVQGGSEWEERDTRLSRLMDEVYAKTVGTISREERKLMQKQGSSPTYGEVTYRGVSTIMLQLEKQMERQRQLRSREVSSTNTNAVGGVDDDEQEFSSTKRKRTLSNRLLTSRLSSADVFYDLGSGLGKFIMQVYFNHPVGRATGVELSESRFNRSIGLSQELVKSSRVGEDALPALGGSYQLLQGDMFRLNISDATVIFVCSTCLTEEVLNQLHQKVVDECPRLRFLISMKRLPKHFVPNRDAETSKKGRVRMLVERKSEFVQTSWANETAVRFYEIEEIPL